MKKREKSGRPAAYMFIEKEKNDYIYMIPTTMIQPHKDFAKIINGLFNDGKIKQVKSIDPSIVKINQKQMEPHQKAFLLAKKYMKQDNTYVLKAIYRDNKNRKMSQRDIETVYRIVASIKSVTPEV